MGDFDGDGVADLAVANQSTQNVSVLMGDGAGLFALKVDSRVGSNPNVVTTGDVICDNGSGHRGRQRERRARRRRRVGSALAGHADPD